MAGDRARRAPVEDLEALDRLLVRARWIGAAVAAPCAFAGWASGLYLNIWGMAAVVGLMILTNLVIVSYSARRLGPAVPPRLRAPRLEGLVGLELASDVVALSLAFHYLGGIESAVPFLGTFHVAAAASRLGAAEARKVVLGLMTGTGLVMMLEYNRALTHWHLMNDWRWYVEREPRYVAVYAFLLAATLILAAWGASGRRGG